MQEDFLVFFKILILYILLLLSKFILGLTCIFNVVRRQEFHANQFSYKLWSLWRLENNFQKTFCWFLSGTFLFSDRHCGGIRHCSFKTQHHLLGMSQLSFLTIYGYIWNEHIFPIVFGKLKIFWFRESCGILVIQLTSTLSINYF